METYYQTIEFKIKTIGRKYIQLIKKGTNYITYLDLTIVEDLSKYEKGSTIKLFGTIEKEGGRNFKLYFIPKDREEYKTEILTKYLSVSFDSKLHKELSRFSFNTDTTKKIESHKSSHFNKINSDKKESEMKEALESEETIETYKVSFGKFEGMTLLEISDKNASYVVWLKTIDTDPLLTLMLDQIFTMEIMTWTGVSPDLTNVNVIGEFQEKVESDGTDVNTILLCLKS